MRRRGRGAPLPVPAERAGVLQEINGPTLGFFMASCIAARILGSCMAFCRTSGDMPPSMLRAATAERLLQAPDRTAAEVNGRDTDLAEAWVKRVESMVAETLGGQLARRAGLGRSF